MNALTPLALSAEPLLRAIAAGGWSTMAELANQSGRHPNNVSRDLGAADKGGLIVREPALALTEAGVAALAAIDRANAETGTNPVRLDDTDQGEGILLLRHDQIHIGKLNPRKKFDPVKMEELVDDIASRGLKTNLHARTLVGDATTHELIAGERRWRAVGMAIERGLLPADYPIRVLVEDMDDAGHRIAALLENIQRDDLTPLEEAEAFAHLVNTTGLTTAEVAELAKKKSREYVQQRIRLLKLTDYEKARLESGDMSLSEARRALANRVEPLELTAREALVLAEVMAATTEPGSYAARWQTALLDGRAEFEDADLGSLLRRNLLQIHTPDDQTPHYRITTFNELAWKQIDATMPQVLSPANRATALLSYRAAVVGADAAEQADTDGKFVTPWLNEPFPFSPEQQATADRLEAEKTARADARAAADAERLRAEADKARLKDEIDTADQAFLDDIRAFEASASQMPHATFTVSFAELLARHGVMPGFTVGKDGTQLVLVDGAGVTLTGFPIRFEAIRRMQAIALNHAMGAPIYSGDDFAEEDEDEQQLDAEQDIDGGDPSEWEPETEEEFWRIVGETFQGRFGRTEARAAELVQAAKTRLDENEIAYGDDSSDWDRLEAQCVATGYAEDFPEAVE